MIENAVTLLAGKLYKGTTEAVGFDLESKENFLLYPQQRKAVRTGVRTKFARNIVGLICDRSGLAFNNGITVLAGVIDPDYDKEWKVILYNTGEDLVSFSEGDRIAQVIFTVTIQTIGISEGASVEYGGVRTGGFGSTGINESR